MIMLESRHSCDKFTEDKGLTLVRQSLQPGVVTSPGPHETLIKSWVTRFRLSFGWQDSD